MLFSTSGRSDSTIFPIFLPLYYIENIIIIFQVVDRHPLQLKLPLVKRLTPSWVMLKIITEEPIILED